MPVHTLFLGLNMWFAISTKIIRTDNCRVHSSLAGIEWHTDKSCLLCIAVRERGCREKKSDLSQ